MTFKEISAWIESAAVLALFGYYAIQAPHTVGSGEALKLYVTVAVAFVVVVVVFNIIAALIHRPEQADERDKLIAAKSSRNASFVLMNGIFLVTLMLLSQWPLPSLAPAAMPAHLLVLTMAAGELTRFVSQIVYYRRGA